MASRKIGKYELFERLGRGGMAEVYRAHHLSLDRYVAIKILHPFLADDPEFKDRFEKEARNIARLKHPGVVQVYDFENDVENENYYMVMELVDGPTLKELLTTLAERGEMMTLAEVLRVMREAAAALAYAHSQKMIHRDVKPANMMLDRDNRVVLTDFGIAKIVTGVQFTSSGGMVGTPAYMAPEQGLGEAGDERSDLYSLGVIFYQLVTGSLPYEAETPLAIILKHLNEPVPSARDINADVPETVDTMIQRLMAKDPEDRYQTAYDLIADIEHIEHGEPLEAKRLVNLQPREITPIYLRTPLRPATTRALVVPNAASAPPRRRIPLWLWLLIGGLIGALLLATVQNQGPLAAILSPATATYTPSPTFTITPTETPTLTVTPSATATATEMPSPTLTATLPATATMLSTNTPQVLPSSTVATLRPTVLPSDTLMPTDTLTPSATLRPTITLTPSITPTATLDITLTLIQATLLADFQTATVNACDFNYLILSQDPPDEDFVAANTPYQREIRLRNTGSCAWERNTALMFISGENFNAGARIIIRDRVNVGGEVTLVFVGETPAASDLLAGTWELRTPGNIRIGQPIVISLNVYGG